MYYYVHSLTIFLISYYLPRSPNFYKVCITGNSYRFCKCLDVGISKNDLISKLLTKLKKVLG